MRYEWDEGKRRINLAKHGVDFAEVWEFDWETSFTFVDDREDYGELREVSLGFVGMKLCQLVYVDKGDVVRVISLRKANRKEITFYAENARSMEGGTKKS